VVFLDSTVYADSALLMPSNGTVCLPITSISGAAVTCCLVITLDRWPTTFYSISVPALPFCRILCCMCATPAGEPCFCRNTPAVLGCRSTIVRCSTPTLPVCTFLYRLYFYGRLYGSFVCACFVDFCSAYVIHYSFCLLPNYPLGAVCLTLFSVWATDSNACIAEPGRFC
jgi:hypothetical protein